MSSRWETENRLAQQAATEGGRIALHSASPMDIRAKESARDIVTAIDLEIEHAVMGILAETPYAVLSEESTSGIPYAMLEEKPVWVIDPIDGTANFANGLEYYGISIGLCRGLDFPVGAVCFPRLAQMYATSGNGQALLNDQPIKHEHKAVSASLVGASFSGFAHDQAHRARQYELFGAVNDGTRGCLRLGSTAASICFTVSGRLQAAYGLRAKIWDAAGSLAVAIAAGCKVMVAPCGDQFSIDYIVGSRDTVALIHDQCVARGLTGESWRVWEG